MTQEIELHNVTMFSKLSNEALAEVAAALKSRRLIKGEILFNLGDPGDELIIVAEGKIAIFAPAEDDPAGGQPIRIFQPGELLGDMAIIDRKPRSLSARAEEDSQILALSSGDFFKLLDQNPEMALSTMAGLSDRIRYTTEFLAEVSQWVQRIAVGDYKTSGVVESEKYQDQTLATLAAEFAQMAAHVQKREETLRKEVAQLKIEIDEVKRKKDADSIMQSEYYQSLKDKVKDLRQQKE